MHSKKVFSTLDAKRGYWQIKVHEDSRPKTGFVTFEGLQVRVSSDAFWAL